MLNRKNLREEKKKLKKKGLLEHLHEVHILLGQFPNLHIIILDALKDLDKTQPMRLPINLFCHIK